jgi:hypothetical protein
VWPLPAHPVEPRIRGSACYVKADLNLSCGMPAGSLRSDHRSRKVAQINVTRRSAPKDSLRNK